MILNSPEILNPTFHCLDEIIQDYGLYIFVGLVYVLMPFSIWALTGGLRRKLLKGESVPHVPPVIVLHLPVGSPPPPAETFDPFPPTSVTAL